MVGSTGGEVIFVVSNFYAAPGFFEVGFWTGDDEVGTEGSCREALALDAGHFSFDVADAG